MAYIQDSAFQTIIYIWTKYSIPILLHSLRCKDELFKVVAWKDMKKVSVICMFFFRDQLQMLCRG